MTLTCTEARTLIRANPHGAELRLHLDECEVCRALAADDARLAHALGEPATPGPREEDFTALLEAVRSEDATARGRLRALPTWVRAGVAFSAPVLIAAVMFAVGRRADWELYPAARMASVLGTLGVAASIGVVLALPRIYRPPKPTALRIGLFVLLILAGFVPALLPVAVEAGVSEPRFWNEIGKCLGLGSLAAFPAVVLLRTLQRDSALHTWSTLFLALAAALGAHLALQLHCAIVDPTHIGVAHSGLALVYAVAAWLVVRWSTRRDGSVAHGSTTNTG